MTLPWYIPGGVPGNKASGSSSDMRGELVLIETAMDKLPGFSGKGLELCRINTGETAMESVASSTLSITFSTVSDVYGDLRDIPPVGTKTGSYALVIGDVGQYVQVGSGGSITIPNSVFSEGDVVTIVNNHSSAITITCTITTAYISGIDADQATVSLATRGLCTIFFLSGTVCVISGAVS